MFFNQIPKIRLVYTSNVIVFSKQKATKASAISPQPTSCSGQMENVKIPPMNPSARRYGGAAGNGDGNILQRFPRPDVAGKKPDAPGGGGKPAGW